MVPISGLKQEYYKHKTKHADINGAAAFFEPAAGRRLEVLKQRNPRSNGNVWRSFKDLPFQEVKQC